VYIPATIVVCLALSVFSYFIVLSVKKQTDEHYAWYTETVGKEFDYALTNLYAQSYTLKNDSAILAYAATQDKKANTAIYSAHTISESLLNRSSIFHYADSIFLYFYSDDSIISSLGWSPSDVYFNGQLSGTGDAFEAWYGIISAKKKSPVWKYCAETDQIIMVLPLNNFAGNVVATLNMALVSERWLDTLPEGSSVHILYPDGSVFYSSRPKDAPALEIKNSDGDVHASHRVLFSAKSSYDWAYYLTLPQNGTIYQTDYILAALIIMFSAVIIYIVLVVIQMYTTNYRPLKTITHMLDTYEEVRAENLKNEYQIVEKALKQVISANEKISGVLRRREQTMTEYMLANLIKGNVSTQDEQWHKDFAIVCPELMERKIVLLAFPNTASSELVGEFYETFLTLPSIRDSALIYCVPMGESSIFLLGLCENGLLSNIGRDIKALLARLNAAEQKSMTCVISSCKESFQQAPEAYQELLTLSKASSTKNGELVYSYDPAKDNLTLDAKPSFSSGMENDFSILIQQRRFHEAQEMAHTIIDGAMKNSVYATLETAKSLMFFLLSREFSKLPDEGFGKADGVSESEEDQLLKKILRTQTPAELQKACCSCIAWLDRDNPSPANPQRHPGNLQIAEICTYIQKNFQDPDLNVSEISRQFHLSMPYLSKLFKDVTGYNVLEYIYLVRLNYAKKQLRETLKSVSCIAQESGFKDPKRLTQLIKKYEGTTPGRFRRE